MSQIYIKDYTNLIFSGVTQEARNKVKEQHLLEKKRIKEGWRYINIKENYQVFVPCDEFGNPTRDGMVRINRQKELLGIKNK